MFTNSGRPRAPARRPLPDRPWTRLSCSNFFQHCAWNSPSGPIGHVRPAEAEANYPAAIEALGMVA